MCVTTAGMPNCRSSCFGVCTPPLPAEAVLLVRNGLIVMAPSILGLFIFCLLDTNDLEYATERGQHLLWDGVWQQRLVHYASH